MDKGTEVSFLAVAREYLQDKYDTESYIEFRAQTSRLNTIVDYLLKRGKKDILFKNIDETWLKTFITFLKKKNAKDRTIANYLLFIRTLFNRALKEDKTIPYPFGKGKVLIKFPEPIKIGLSKKEMKQLFDLDLPWGKRLWHDRNFLVFCFSMGGMRGGDAMLSKWNSFADGRFYYIMGKNRKPGSIKTSELTERILELYRSSMDSTGLIFDYLKRVNLTDREAISKKINNVLSNITNRSCKQLKELTGIKKKLSPHIMRHSFATIAGNGVPVQTLQKIYRHSSVTTTIGYQQSFIHQDADEAIDGVTSFDSLNDTTKETINPG